MKIIAIIICYKTTEQDIKKTLSSIYNQVESVIIVNNDSTKYDYSMYKNVINIILGDNYGIAYAQNIGIKKAIEMDSDYILLSDQDTIYPENYIESFYPYIEQNKASMYCPVFFDTISKSYAPVVLKKLIPIYNICEPTYVEQAIASGSIINLNCLNNVGLMNEALFIDYVDHEFCWRLISKGYKILTIPSIVITHSLGKCQKTILNKKITIWSDIRYYYLIRNSIYLSFYCKHIDFKDRIKLQFSAFTYSRTYFLLKHNLKSIALIIKAIFDGLFKKLGRKSK